MTLSISPDWQAIGARIQRLRVSCALLKKSDRTLESVAQHISTTRFKLCEYEAGKPMPARILFALAHLYGVSTDYLYGLTNDPDEAWDGQIHANRLMNALESHLKGFVVHASLLHQVDVDCKAKLDTLHAAAAELAAAGEKLAQLNKGFNENAKGGATFTAALAKTRAAIEQCAAAVRLYPPSEGEINRFIRLEKRAKQLNASDFPQHYRQLAEKYRIRAYRMDELAQSVEAQLNLF